MPKKPPAAATEQRAADIYKLIPLSAIRPSPTNPRQSFNESNLQELAESIRSHGVVQPIVVRWAESFGGEQYSCYEIVAGERRWRASKIAEQAEIPAMVRDLTEEQVLEIQVIENDQREDVHPLEQAAGYQRLIDGGRYDIPTLAARTGRTEEFIRGRVGLAGLIDWAKEAFWKDHIRIGHATALARLDHEMQTAAMRWLFDCRSTFEDGKLERQWGGVPSVPNFLGWIRSNAVLQMVNAPFDLGDPTLNPAAGACTDCPLRTINRRGLFPELVDQDVCTSRSCYAIKLTEFRARMLAKAEAGTILAVSQRWEKPTSGMLSTREYQLVQPVSGDSDEAFEAWVDRLIDQAGEEDEIGLALKSFDRAVSLMLAVEVECNPDVNPEAFQVSARANGLDWESNNAAHLDLKEGGHEYEPPAAKYADGAVEAVLLEDSGGQPIARKVMVIVHPTSATDPSVTAAEEARKAAREAATRAFKGDMLWRRRFLVGVCQGATDVWPAAGVVFAELARFLNDTGRAIILEAGGFDKEVAKGIKTTDQLVTLFGESDAETQQRLYLAIALEPLVQLDEWDYDRRGQETWAGLERIAADSGIDVAAMVATLEPVEAEAVKPKGKKSKVATS